MLAKQVSFLSLRPRAEAMEYVRGSIKKISISNFMTHTFCQFAPGPRLNMIIGANGSGKSSILCAISLGLGGEPKDLGRANTINAYIKNGESEASIEVELFEPLPGRRNPVIKRVIHTGQKSASRGNSKWYLNGCLATFEQISQVLRDLNINVANLCQVLPQDRVGDFSKFDPVTLLNETVRSSLSEVYISHKEDIYVLADRLQTDITKLKRKNAEIEQLTKSVHAMQTRVDDIKSRKKLEAELELVNKLVPWLYFQARRCSLQTERENLQGQEQDIKKLKNQLQKHIENVKDMNKRGGKVKASYSVQCSSFREKHRVLQDKSHELKSYMRKQTNDVFSDIHQLEEEEANIESNISQYEIEVEQIKSAMAEIGDIGNLKSEMKAISKRKMPLNDEIVDYDKEIEIQRLSVNNLKHDLSRQRRILQSSKNEHEQISKFIKNNFREEVSNKYQAVIGNQNSFKKPVLGPIFLEVAISNPLFASYVEMLLKFSILMSYVTQDAGDRSKLNGRRIDTLNVEFRDENDLKHLSFKPLSAYSGHRDLAEMGIVGFGFEFIVGHKVVQEAIFRVTALPTILFATKEFDSIIESTNVQNALELIQKVVGRKFRIISPNFITSMNISKYSGESILHFNPVRFKPKAFHSKTIFFKNLGKSKKNQRKSFLDRKREFVRIEQDLEEAQSVLNNVSSKKNLLLEKLKSLKQEYSRLERRGYEYKTLNSRLEVSSLSLEKAKMGRERDFERERKHLQELIFKKLTLIDLNYISPIVKDCESVVSELPPHSEATLKYQGVVIRLSILKQKKTILETSIELKNKESSDLKKRINGEEKSLVNKEKELQSTIPLVEYQDKFKSTNIRSLEAAKQKISELEQQLHSLGYDPSLLLEYESNRKQIAALKPEVKELSLNVETLTQELKEKQKGFEDVVKGKVSIINKKYVEMFHTINEAGFKCEGQVKFIKNAPDKVQHINNANKFGYENFMTSSNSDSSKVNYGIAIFVKFRQSQQLELLNSEVQSGGERSLSTFIYLLSLQECSAAPFRVVDEINQGMDAIKERLAFHCLVENSCKPGLPQYFLITPKLLSGLNYGKSVQVNFVQNGAHAPLQEFMSITSILSKLGEENGSCNADDSSCANDSDLENTPISNHDRNKDNGNVLKSELPNKRQKLR